MIKRFFLKHFVLLVSGLVIALGAVIWLLGRLVDDAIMTSAFRIISVVGPVATLLVVERRRGAQPGVFSIAATLAAAFLFAWVTFELDARWWIKGLLLVVLVTPVMSIANALYRADIRQSQRRRDAHATRLVQAVLAGKSVERFAFYLRPFVSTDRLTAQALPAEIDVGEVPVHLDVETLLVRSFRATTPVIALGHSGEVAEGAARTAVSEDNWQETVKALTRRAEFIVMVPLSRPGTMWELEWLKQSDLLNKVLFIMPESPYETPSGVVRWGETDDRIFDAGVRIYKASAHMLDLSKEWLEVERAAERIGLDFPPLAAVGALFTMNPTTGAVKDIVPLALSMMARRVRYLRTNIVRFGLLPGSEAPIEFLRDFAKAVFLGGRTLEFALVRAADGFAAWGDAATAMRLIQRGIEAADPRPQFATGYINYLPALIEKCVGMGHDRAAVHYRDFARLVRSDSQLASLATSETLQEIDSLMENLKLSSAGNFAAAC